MATQQIDVQAAAPATQSEVEAKAQAAPTTEACEKKCVGRAGSEWLALMPALGSITMIVFGCLYFSDCSGIPSLPAYAIVFGALNVLNGAIAIAFRTAKAKAEGGDGGAAAKVEALVGLAILGCAVWGAVITFGETSRFSDSPDCANTLYVAGFISAVIPLIIISFMLVACLGLMLKKKFGSKATDTPDSPMAKTAQDDQEDKETSQA